LCNIYRKAHRKRKLYHDPGNVQRRPQINSNVIESLTFFFLLQHEPDETTSLSHRTTTGRGDLRTLSLRAREEGLPYSP
jgi:hypothetical protein